MDIIMSATTKQEELFSKDQYMNFVSTFVQLLDRELTKRENILREEKDYTTVIAKMPALISLVNTIAYLRGQDNMFVSVQSQIKDHKKLYAYESFFEKKLQTIIETLISLPDIQASYRNKLEEYFITFRS